MDESNKFFKIWSFIMHFIVEILIILGVVTLIIATFLFNNIIGLYATGVILLIFGLFFAKFKK